MSFQTYPLIGKVKYPYGFIHQCKTAMSYKDGKLEINKKNFGLKQMELIWLKLWFEDEKSMNIKKTDNAKRSLDIPFF